MEDATLSTVSAFACTMADEMAARRGGRRAGQWGERRGTCRTYTVASCVPGAFDALPSILSSKANAVKMAPVDSLPRRMTPCPLASASA